MALICCPECSESVSDKALVCPHCGLANPGNPDRCPECGQLTTKLQSTCKACGFVLEMEMAEDRLGKDPPKPIPKVPPPHVKKRNAKRRVKGVYRNASCAPLASHELLTALLLCFLFGSLGLHRIYLGYSLVGFALLTLTALGAAACYFGSDTVAFFGLWLGILPPALFSLIDLFLILFGFVRKA